MRIQPNKPVRSGDKQKPEKPKGLPGLLIYGALTILGGLALVVWPNSFQRMGAGALSRSNWPCLR